MKKTNHPLDHCILCPRGCGVNRNSGFLGFCKAGATAKVALVSSHFWEEPPISGTIGSGTIFFSHCNLSCIFCQNHTISQEGHGIEITLERLAELFLEQQGRGLHNINLVSPTQYIPQIAQAIDLAKRAGLHIPVVYNTNGYETLEGLGLLEGRIDIYLPDFKYWDNALGEKYSNAPHYRKFATQALLEMRRQTGPDVFQDGLMKKGMILRHLILPSHHKDSLLILDWIRDNLGENTCVSLLHQYTPMYLAEAPLHRKLTTFEYQKVTNHFMEIGLKHGFSQKRSAATQNFTPQFNLRGIRKETNNGKGEKT